MSKISILLDSLFQSKGNNQNLWEELKNLIENSNDQIEPFCFYMKNRINDGNKQEILLALNILDFVVDLGKLLLWIKVDDINFLSCIINILKTNKDQDIQNAALYLIQKWAYKFKNYPSIQNSKSVFYSLRYNNILFPNNLNNSYKTYLSQNNMINNNKNILINNNMNNAKNDLNKISNNKNNINKLNNNINHDLEKQNSIRQSRIPSNPNDYIKNIKLDLNPNNYEKKYKRLVNKLFEWTNLIQEINILINNNQNGQNNNKLKQLNEDLKIGKKLLVDTIQGPKLKDEILMVSSLNICEDMVMTLNRIEKVFKGEDPGPFLSSFTRDNNPNMHKIEDKPKIVVDDFKLQGPEERIGKLGFGDTIMTKYLDNDINNNNFDKNNSLSDLFEKNNKTMKLDMGQYNDEHLKKDDEFFMNMSNSNIKLDDEKFNKFQNFSQFVDNNKNNILNNPDFIINEKKIGNIKINAYNNNDNRKNLEQKSNASLIVNNNDIKRLIAYEKNKNNNQLFYQSQKFPISHINLNSEKVDDKIYKSLYVNNMNNYNNNFGNKYK